MSEATVYLILLGLTLTAIVMLLAVQSLQARRLTAQQRRIARLSARVRVRRAAGALDALVTATQPPGRGDR